MISSQEEGEEEFWLGLLGEVDAHPPNLGNTAAANDDGGDSLHSVVTPADDTPFAPSLWFDETSAHVVETSPASAPHDATDHRDADKPLDGLSVPDPKAPQQHYFEIDLNQPQRADVDLPISSHSYVQDQHQHQYQHHRLQQQYAADGQGGSMFMAEKSPLRCYKQRYSLSLEKETPSLTTAAAAAASSSRIWGSDADADSGDDEDAFRDRLEFVFCQRASELSRDQSVAASPSSGCHRSENNEQHRRLYNYLHGVGVFTTNTTASLTNVLYGANVSGASESADDVAAGNGDVGSAGCDPVDGFIEAARSHGQQSALTGAVAEYVSATGASMLDWKDLMVAKVTLLVHSNVYLTSLVGCVHQSTLLMCDRLQGLAAFYLHKLQGDDPERIHLEQLRDAPDWQHLLLRCSMASLTWKQRQMLELTRDGGLLNSEELREMMRRQVEEYDRARVIKIASEYFYFSNDGNSAGGCNNAMRGGIGSSDALPAEDCAADRLLREEVAPGDDDADGSPGVCSSRALISNIHAWLVSEADSGDEDAQYFLARFFSAPAFREDAQCSVCRAVFGITLFRHHCRFCGNSVCHQHSLQRRCIFRYGMVQPVRVCDSCCEAIDETQRRDLLLWRNLRVESFLNHRLIPYFHPSVDRNIDKAIRMADYSFLVAKRTFMFNFPAKVALDAVDILRRYGLAGLTGLLLRQDFMESVEMLKKISGMESMFSSLSLHELTACVYYKLAIERGLRGCNPDGEHQLHTPSATPLHGQSACGGEVPVELSGGGAAGHAEQKCRDAHDRDVDLAIRYSPLALHFVYEETAVDCQRLARLQGWETIFTNMESELAPEQPCYALFGHRSEGPSTREVVLAIRGTQTVQDVVTDIRAAPTQFPPAAAEVQSCLRGEPVSATAEGSNRCAGAVDDVGDGAINGKLRNNKRKQWEWLNVPKHRTYACGGMLRSALHVLREVGPSLVRLHREGFQVTLVGHSLGGAVAALMTYLLKYGGYSDGSGGENISIPDVQGFTYGCPSCVDAETSDILRSNVVSVVVGDDVISRITPQSIRLLLRELMVFREQMFRHLQQDWEDVMRRAAELWSPRQRDAPPMFNREVEAESLINLKDDRSLRYDPTYTSESEGQRDPSANDDEAIVVEEESLKALWLPGRVLHLYRHRGQWRGAEVSRDFPLLRFVSVQSNMFEDHCSEQITNALLEMRTARRLSQQQSGRCALPAWTPFDHSNACVCCNNSFTWHSTFRGEAQEFRDRNNCHFCGRLVCGPCSMQSRSMPQFGFIFPRRICDQCVMKGDFASPS